MGTCVIGGLITSTLLTLIVVPVMYSLVDDFGGLFRNRRSLVENAQAAT
jgi:HAE1 family hydrophobic/amphiphilic exporter-1